MARKSTKNSKGTKEKKQSRLSKKTRLFTAITVVLSLSLIASVISTQVSIAREKEILDEINKEIASESLIKDEYERLSQQNNEDEYMERVAREKLGYALPDEEVYVDLPGSE